MNNACYVLDFNRVRNRNFQKISKQLKDPLLRERGVFKLLLRKGKPSKKKQDIS